MTEKPQSAVLATTTKQLMDAIDELIASVRRQQDMLTKRNVILSPAAQNQLTRLRNQIRDFTNNITRSQVELTQLRKLAETTALITSTLDVDQVLNQVMDTVIQLTGAQRGYIVLRNPEAEAMEFRVARGMEQDDLDKTELIVSHTVVQRVVESGEPLLADNASMDERLADSPSIIGFDLRSILAVPLKTRGKLTGVVYCDNSIQYGLFQQHEMNLLTAFADQAAVAIANARLFEDARQQLQEVISIRDLMDNIFSSVASGIVTLNRGRTIDTLNLTATEILDVSAEDAQGKRLVEMIPGDMSDLEIAIERVWNGGDLELVELHPTLPNLGERQWLLSITPLSDERDGSVQGLAVVLDDETETREREQRLSRILPQVPMANLDHLTAADVEDMQVEVREISALFCDVRGFTTFSESLQPEDLMRVINRYLSLASDAVTLYDGIVDKYMGDAVTGIFNSQLNPQKDHAVRCVRAAMSLVFDLYALHEVLPEDQRLFYGTGIHTGPAVLGNVGGGGREEFSALGEAMDICKLLQENAGPGEIIISQATYEQVQDNFECEPIELTKTKGLDVGGAYRVVKHKRGATGSLVDPELLALLNDDD